MVQQQTGACVTALVPMKARSVRVPGKNVRLLDGIVLWEHIVRTLLAAHSVDAVAVDTDSDEIKTKLRADYPDVIIIDRLPELAGPDVPMNAVLGYDLSQLPGDVFLQTHSTNPLLRPETVDAAVDAFLSQDEHDSLFTVTEIRKRFFDARGYPVNHDPAVLINTQDLDPLLEENSCMYVFTRASFERADNRLGARPILFPIAAEEAIDIDDKFDFTLVECVLEARRRANAG